MIHHVTIEVEDGRAIAGCTCGSWLEMCANRGDTKFYGIAFIDGCRAIDLCLRRLSKLDPAESWVLR